DITLIRIDAERRKDPAARAEALNDADAAILCLPDDAAREAAAWVRNPRTRLIDASTAHRTAPGWTYGFPEMDAAQRVAIAASTRISNPGCYPTGFVALVRPLTAQGLLPADWPFTVHAVSGYSGGGKAMIAEFEDEAAPGYTRVPYRIYALGLGHKHVREMQAHAGLAHPPLFAPAVGRYAQGMIVEVPLQTRAMATRPTRAALQEALAAHYAGARFVTVASLAEADSLKTLDPEGLNGTNHLKLYVFGDDAAGQVRLVALLDNLGKGASGAAVQSMNLALGLDEGTGL
ncbi:MAG: N-acetyl-gamma-glutamyl-phosphate reductase, partial [Hyphomonadaceae bacterium]|nr:N-acetyl-gamma-glutamyl-phosphate reductase [Hyphomonadaceae bacterium]